MGLMKFISKGKSERLAAFSAVQVKIFCKHFTVSADSVSKMQRWIVFVQLLLAVHATPVVQVDHRFSLIPMNNRTSF